MSNKCCQIHHGDRRSLISDRIEVARRFYSRLRGLLGRKSLDEGEGLLLSPCSSIHCFGMRFPIDAIFMDGQYKVVAIKPNMKPGSMASHRQARYVLELKAGQAARHKIEIGEHLHVTWE